jgi:hypothetical protein
MAIEALTIGRVGVDLYPEQSGVPLAGVSTFAKSRGGAPPHRAVAAARPGSQRRSGGPPPPAGTPPRGSAGARPC